MADIYPNDLLLLSLTNYYSKNNKIHVLKEIIESNSKFSLRLIDYYVTNYCREHNIVYILKKKGHNEYFNVFMNYRSQLKAFNKVLFDPFRRRDKIIFHYDGDGELVTTIGQLNFFRWAIENDIIQHLEMALSNVEADMISKQKIPKGDGSSIRSSKDYFHKNSIKNMTTFNGNTLISFK
jgi:hypothetical protein